MKRLEFLDGLRGLAALYVIVHHVPLILSPQLPIPDLIKPFVMYGGTGVVLFFVISGFSLAMTMPSHYETDHPMASYAISRLSRIAPLFYVLIIYNVAVAWFLHGWTFQLDRIIKSVLFVFNLFPDVANGVVGASWTIGVEMVFYAAFPLVYGLTKNIWNALSLALLGVIASTIFFHFYTERGAVDFSDFRGLSIVTHFPTFVLGIAAYLALQNLSSHPSRESIGQFLTTLGLGGILWLMANHDGLPFLYPTQSPGIFYALMVVGFGLAPLPIVANRVMQFYGRICYSLYLWHAPVIYALEPMLQRIRTFGLSDTATLLICYSIVLSVATAVAWASYHLIETPGLRLGRRLKQTIGTLRPAGLAKPKIA